MAAKLIHDSRFFSGFLHHTGNLFLRLTGWKKVGEVPDIPKFVAIAAPHTSNWDFPIFMAVVGAFRVRARFFGKHTLFDGPFGWLFYWLGGVPVERDTRAAADMVEGAVKAFEAHDDFILGIAPEGTRSKVERWKTGFYRIAVAANVPILMAYLDASKKEVGLGPLFYPTGDMTADMAAIHAFYADKQGINPANQ
ncbi:lysophospholipid acyltransferase family protein [Pseudokordiimonas caeni]|uniref:lysophospholipid acyltransferase family protein n=1 Tax=Pseudokordiimonas caeni TaxID=2997908 RepID=UPI002811978B|nr:lysophospholipid acyltransferase family protein [Pseudokordiimonas caeni]